MMLDIGLQIAPHLDKGEPLRNKLLAVVHDEDAPDVQLNVVSLLPAGTEWSRYQPQCAWTLNGQAYYYHTPEFSRLTWGHKA